MKLAILGQLEAALASLFRQAFSSCVFVLQVPQLVFEQQAWRFWKHTPQPLSI